MFKVTSYGDIEYFAAGGQTHSVANVLLLIIEPARFLYYLLLKYNTLHYIKK